MAEHGLRSSQDSKQPLLKEKSLTFFLNSTKVLNIPYMLRRIFRIRPPSHFRYRDALNSDSLSTRRSIDAMAAQLRFNPTVHLAGSRRAPAGPLHPPSILPFIRSTPSSPTLLHALSSSDPSPLSGGSGDNPPGGSGGSRGVGGGGDHHHHQDSSEDPSDEASGPLEIFLRGWRSRVSADPQFPFKVLMEQLVGVTACVLGDMASRPNFGLNELDFVFSTLVVGSILNFVLMYLLAPTAAASSSASSLSALPSYMFEPGPYSPLARLATFATKGAVFAAVGFAAGLTGTLLSDSLISLRKKLDPEFETPNKPPPTLLNSLTWALHMGVSSNLRYQTLNGVECLMAGALPSAGFKASVVVLRCLNNVLGGVSFVALARMTGSQKTAGDEEEVVNSAAAEVGGEEIQKGESSSK